MGALRTSANNAVPYNQWSHVLVTWNSNGYVTIYVNGIVSGVPGTSGNPNFIQTLYPIALGGRSKATDRNFDGVIDEVHIWNRVLTSQEITDLYDLYQ